MIFTVKLSDGTYETRRHIPYDVLPDGAGWKAIHKGNGRLLGRNVSQQELTRHMDTCTEVVHHYKPAR